MKPLHKTLLLLTFLISALAFSVIDGKKVTWLEATSYLKAPLVKINTDTAATLRDLRNKPSGSSLLLGITGTTAAYGNHNHTGVYAAIGNYFYGTLGQYQIPVKISTNDQSLTGSDYFTKSENMFYSVSTSGTNFSEFTQYVEGNYAESKFKLRGTAGKEVRMSVKTHEGTGNNLNTSLAEIFADKISLTGDVYLNATGTERFMKVNVFGKIIYEAPLIKTLTINIPNTALRTAGSNTTVLNSGLTERGHIISAKITFNKYLSGSWISGTIQSSSSSKYLVLTTVIPESNGFPYLLIPPTLSQMLTLNSTIFFHVTETNIVDTDVTAVLQIIYSDY